MAMEGPLQDCGLFPLVPRPQSWLKASQSGLVQDTSICRMYDSGVQGLRVQWSVPGSVDMGLERLPVFQKMIRNFTLVALLATSSHQLVFLDGLPSPKWATSQEVDYHSLLSILQK